MKNTTNWRRWKRIQSRPQGWRGVWAEKAEAALQKWRESDEGFKRCAKVRAIHAETLRLGCKICNSKEKVNYRDMWCPRNDCMTKNTRGFGHPQGMIYVGKSGRFVYLPIPKVASTTLRKWSVAAYKEEAEETEAKWLLPDSEKAIADRLLGMAMWHDVPRAVRAKTAAFALVRDPLERFSSALKELFAYEKGPQERRTWGRHVLRRQHFFAQAAKRSSNASAISLFASGGVIRVRKELEIVIGDAVRDLACDPDWNEHLTPQRLFFPDKFLAAGPAIAPSINIVALLPSAARTAGLDHELAKNFAIAGNKLNSVTSKQKMNIHTNAREGWPQPNDIRPALDHADEYTQSGLISTRYLWCWLYAIDYTSFPFF
uniref:Sulfotransferase domain-containing protein n=1 Tax=Aureoumbra lagunensis TaxID=44058 RepID=A0A7S3NJP9_9STRA